MGNLPCFIEMYIPKTSSSRLEYVLEKARRFGELEETEFEYVARFKPEAIEEAIALWDMVRYWKGAAIYYRGKRVNKRFFNSKALKCMRERIMKEDAEIYCSSEVGIPPCFDLSIRSILPIHLDDKKSSFGAIKDGLIKIDKDKLVRYITSKYKEVKHCIFAPSREEIERFMDAIPEAIALDGSYNGIWADYVKQLQVAYRNRKERQEERLITKGVIKGKDKEEPLITDSTKLPYCLKCKEVVFDPKEEYAVSWDKAAICFGITVLLSVMAEDLIKKESLLLMPVSALSKLFMLGTVVFFLAALVSRIFRIKRYLCPVCKTKVKWLKGAEAAEALTDTMFKNVEIKVMSGNTLDEETAQALAEAEDAIPLADEGDVYWEIYECSPRLLLGGYLEKVWHQESEIMVESFTGRNTQYKVNLRNLTCTCPDFEKERKRFSCEDVRRLCKHLLYCMGESVDLPELVYPEQAGYLFKYFSLKRYAPRPSAKFRKIEIDTDYMEMEAVVILDRGNILYSAEITEKDYGSTWMAVLLGTEDGSVKLVWDPNEWGHFPPKIREMAETLLAKVASQYEELSGTGPRYN